MRAFGIHFVPLFVPLERRLQTLAVAFHVWTFFFMGVTSTLLLFFLLFTPFCFLPILYGIWYWLDWDQSSRGGRPYPWIRRLAFWRYYRDYFPVKLIKTTDLDPRCRYIMGCHPHGIMGCGFWSALATEANGWGTLFPGIDLHLLGMKVIFQFPLYREYCMALGLCDVSRESIEYWMRKAPGTAVGIVVGGAKEAREDDYQNVKLVLKNRKGFVKLAIQTGAHLVPVFSFGENDVYRLYHPDDGSWIDRFQRFVHAKTRLAPVVFFGRGFFNYTMGFLPKRRPITVIIGAPIPTVQNPQPTQEEIDHVHRRYLDDLRDLFDSHKASCGYPNAQLSYID